MNRSDEALIIAHRQGDPAAFGELVRRYAGSLYGYLTHMSNDMLSKVSDIPHEAAEDGKIIEI